MSKSCEPHAKWRDTEVEVLIASMKERDLLTLSDGKKRRSLEVFGGVRSDLARKGFFRTEEHIRRKMSELRKQYFEAARGEPEHRYERCDHYDALHELFTDAQRKLDRREGRARARSSKRRRHSPNGSDAPSSYQAKASKGESSSRRSASGGSSSVCSSSAHSGSQQTNGYEHSNHRPSVAQQSNGGDAMHNGGRRNNSPAVRARPDKFHLKQSAYQPNLNNSLTNLCKNDRYADVMLLVCNDDDNIAIPAHRLVLGTFSPYFANVFEKVAFVPSSATIYVALPPTVTRAALQCLLQYMYTGEAIVHADTLDDVMMCGEFLRINGFSARKSSSLQKAGGQELVSVPLVTVTKTINMDSSLQNDGRRGSPTSAPTTATTRASTPAQMTMRAYYGSPSPPRKIARHYETPSQQQQQQQPVFQYSMPQQPKQELQSLQPMRQHSLRQPMYQEEPLLEQPVLMQPNHRSQMLQQRQYMQQQQQNMQRYQPQEVCADAMFQQPYRQQQPMMQPVGVPLRQQAQQRYLPQQSLQSLDMNMGQEMMLPAQPMQTQRQQQMMQMQQQRQWHQLQTQQQQPMEDELMEPVQDLLPPQQPPAMRQPVQRQQSQPVLKQQQQQQQLPRQQQQKPQRQLEEQQQPMEDELLETVQDLLPTSSQQPPAVRQPVQRQQSQPVLKQQQLPRQQQQKPQRQLEEQQQPPQQQLQRQQQQPPQQQPEQQALLKEQTHPKPPELPAPQQPQPLQQSVQKQPPPQPSQQPSHEKQPQDVKHEQQPPVALEDDIQQLLETQAPEEIQPSLLESTQGVSDSTVQAQQSPMATAQQPLTTPELPQEPSSSVQQKQAQHREEQDPAQANDLLEETEVLLDAEEILAPQETQQLMYPTTLEERLEHDYPKLQEELMELMVESQQRELSAKLSLSRRPQPTLQQRLLQKQKLQNELVRPQELLASQELLAPLKPRPVQQQQRPQSSQLKPLLQFRRPKQQLLAPLQPERLPKSKEPHQTEQPKGSEACAKAKHCEEEGAGAETSLHSVPSSSGIVQLSDSTIIAEDDEGAATTGKAVEGSESEDPTDRSVTRSDSSVFEYSDHRRLKQLDDQERSMKDFEYVSMNDLLNLTCEDAMIDSVSLGSKSPESQTSHFSTRSHSSASQGKIDRFMTESIDEEPTMLNNTVTYVSDSIEQQVGTLPDQYVSSRLNCQLCYMSFTTPTDWVNHVSCHCIMDQGLLKRRRVSNDNDSEYFRCDMCSSYFLSAQDWQIHVAKHHTSL